MRERERLPRCLAQHLEGWNARGVHFGAGEVCGAGEAIRGRWLEVRGETCTGNCPPSFPPQGALALALPVGPGVVQSLSYHPLEPCLLTAVGGSVHCWREEAYEAEGGTG